MRVTSMKVNRVFLSIVGIIVALILTVVARPYPTNAQTNNAKPIKYGDVVDGTIANGTGKSVQLYSFEGEQGDKISILVVRRSGNLRPVVALTDPTQKGDKFLLTGGTPVGTTGTLASVAGFVLPETKTYVIIVTRENLDKGTTTGQFRLILVKGKAATDATEVPTEVALDEATPTPRPTRKPTVKATATPADEPTAEPEATETPADNTAGEPVQSFEVGQSPIFSLWNGDNLFVSNYGDGTISELDGDGNNVRTIKVGGVPFAMAWDGARLWVADLGTDAKPGTSVNLFDTKGKKVGTFKVGSQPFSLSYDADNQRMWIALYGDNRIVSVDPKGKILSSIDTDTNPNTVLWVGDKLWATLAGPQDKVGNTVIAIDSDSNLIDTFTVGKNPADLAWNDTDQLLYVANYDDGTVTALDADGKKIGTYKVGKQPGALSWDGTHLWVSLGGDKAVVALSNKGKLVTKVPLDIAPNGITNDGNGHVWVANQGTTDAPGSVVTRIDTEALFSKQ